MKSIHCIFLLFLSFQGSWANETEAKKALSSHQIYKALTNAELDGRSLDVTGVTLERDVHRFALNNGTIYFTKPIEDRTVMAVYVGSGIYELAAENVEEQHLLGLVHNQEGMTGWKGDFDALLLMFTDNTFAELKAGKTLGQGSNPSAAKALSKIRKNQDDEFRINFRMRLARAMTNRGLDKEGLFLAFPLMKKAPPLLVAVDPLGSRGIDFGGARPTWEPSFVYAADDRKGGFWYTQPLKGQANEVVPHQYVDALHYHVETEITGFENISGTTKMKFKPMIDDLRSMPIYLTGSMGISDVGLVNEAEESVGVSAVQSIDTEIFFANPLKKGATYTLTLKYSGRKVLYDVGNGNYYVVRRTRWYPNVGVFGDRADYKLVFKAPKGEKLIATGKLVNESMEDGRRVTEWESEEPMTVAGFNYGSFLESKQKEPGSGLELSVHHQELVNEDLVHNAMADAVNSVRLYSSFFGKLPYSTLAMTQQTQAGYGQAWPSLVFLPYISFLDRTVRASLGREANDVIDKSLAPHEVAHQWFGHQVSAATYRDVWLEEGFSEFAAGLLIQQTLGWGESDQFWAYTHKGITAKIRGSKKRYYEVAPIYAGMRMETQKTPGSYSTLVYKKGAFVLHMLRMMMMDTRDREDPDKAFRAMMLDYFKTFKGQNITTAQFQGLVEKHMTRNMNATGNGKMDWFFNQWVYGRTIPEYESSLKVKKEGDKYRVTGSISQKGVPDDFLVMMPVYVDFGKGHMVRFAAIPFKGEMTRPADWLLPLPKKPKRVLINAHYDVLTTNAVGKK